MWGQACMDRQMDEGWVNGVGDATNCRVPNPKLLFAQYDFFALFELLGINSSPRKKNSSGFTLFKRVLLDKPSWCLAALSP